jgi:hypothetical protein
MIRITKGTVVRIMDATHRNYGVQAVVVSIGKAKTPGAVRPVKLRITGSQYDSDATLDQLAAEADVTQSSVEMLDNVVKEREAAEEARWQEREKQDRAKAISKHVDQRITDLQMLARHTMEVRRYQSGETAQVTEFRLESGGKFEVRLDPEAQIGFGRGKAPEATVNWSSIGTVSLERAEVFAREMLTAIADAKRQRAEYETAWVAANRDEHGLDMDRFAGIISVGVR